MEEITLDDEDELSVDKDLDEVILLSNIRSWSKISSTMDCIFFFLVFNQI